jgi:hypothetical protein
MPPFAFIPPAVDDDLRRSFGARLQALNAAMDAAYDRVAESYGFTCNGCADNCCWSRFHHHTLIEYIALQTGLAGLTPDRRAGVIARARQAVLPPTNRRRPCPLLEDDRCLLYRHRPMICRLHGIPHRLMRPDGAVREGDGCAAFHDHCGPATRRLDRTPFYGQLAVLEKELRVETGFSGRVHLTVAEMIAAMIREAGAR